jgi:hypothetical protein
MKIAEGQKKCFSHHVAIKSSQEPELYRGVSSYSKMGGQVVMRQAAADRKRLLFCQNMGGKLPTLSTLPTRH